MIRGKRADPADQESTAEPGNEAPISDDTEAGGTTPAGETATGAGDPSETGVTGTPGAEEEVARHREAMLRMQAEMDNLRKRMQRESEKSRKFALERIMKDLLQVRDSMERGLEAADDTATVDSLREGQELTLRMLSKVMEDNALEVIDPAGATFDPELHEAMAVLPNEQAEENTVLEVLQKGFRLHDRLIRPARVIVSRKP